MSQHRTTEVSEAEIAVHWQEEDAVLLHAHAKIVEADQPIRGRGQPFWVCGRDKATIAAIMTEGSALSDRLSENPIRRPYLRPSKATLIRANPLRLR